MGELQITCVCIVVRYDSSLLVGLHAGGQLSTPSLPQLHSITLSIRVSSHSRLNDVFNEYNVGFISGDLLSLRISKNDPQSIC